MPRTGQDRTKARLKRLEGAQDSITKAWDVLDPGDISEEKWGMLQSGWVSLQASITRLRQKK